MLLLFAALLPASYLARLDIQPAQRTAFLAEALLVLKDLGTSLVLPLSEDQFASLQCRDFGTRNSYRPKCESAAFYLDERQGDEREDVAEGTRPPAASFKLPSFGVSSISLDPLIPRSLPVCSTSVDGRFST